MKKISSLLVLMVLMAVQAVMAAPITQPDPTKTYMIQHSSSLFMTVSGNSLKIMSAGNGDTQKVTFVPVEGEEGVYNILFDNGKYLGTDKSWTSLLMSDPSDRMTHFELKVSYLEDYIVLRNLGHYEATGGPNDYFGTDNNSEGGGIFTNKGGNDGKHLWQIVEATDGLITASLENAIANAEAILAKNEVSSTFTQDAVAAVEAAIAAGKEGLNASTQAEVNAAADALNAFVSIANTFIGNLASANTALSTAEVGDKTGAYPQEAADAMAEALATAVAAWNGADATALTEANTALVAATSAFASQRYVFVPKAGAQYYIINTSTNLMLGISSSNEAILDDITAENNQKFEIIPVEGSNIAFNLKIADGSGYLARKGNWNTTVVSDPTQDVAKIEFEISDLANNVYFFKKLNAWGYMATDGSTVGTLVYTDKGNNYATAKWQIKEVVEGELLTGGFDSAVAAAESYLAKAVAGDQPGQYPQEAIDALTAALTAAKQNTASTQAELNEVVNTLKEANANFLAAKIDPYFVPAENTYYRFSVRKYQSNYTTNAEDKAATASFDPMNKAQWLTFQPVEGAKYTYIVKNDGKALHYDGTFAEVSDADAPKWTTVYTGLYNSVPYFALVEYDDPTKCMTFGSGKNFAIQNFNAGEIAHWGRILPVDPVNDPDVTSLEDWAAYCRVVLSEIDRGNAIGQYSDAKCEAFSALIEETANFAGATQEEVNAKTAALQTAVEDFRNNPNAVIKDELEAAIAAAKAKAAAAEIGIEIGQYYESEIEAFEAQIAEYEAQANTVSEQEACDALTEEVKAATEAFAGNEEVQPVADVLADAIKCAEALYDAEKDNIGDNQGERPQEVVDAFAAAIATAKAVETPDVADLEALLDARASFLNGAISVNRTPLRKAIAAAEADKYADLQAGEFDGNYPQEAIDTFTEALAGAKAAEADMSKTQEEIDACTKALNDAMSALDKSVVTIKFTELDAALTKAEEAVASATEIGDAEGKCPQIVVDALQAVINEAKAIDRAAINQADVDAMAANLVEATAKFNADLVKSTGINEVLVEAQDLLDNAEAGFKPGNYPSSAIEGLHAAIEAALEVSLNTASTQAELIAAVANLKAAIETFKAQVIAPNDLTSINALIAEAEEFIKANGNDDFVLALALEDAKAIVADADNHTKTEIAKAEKDLRTALEYARENVGVAGVVAEGFSIKVAVGNLVVEGLAGNCVIAVYTLDGRMIAFNETSESTFTLALGSGKYAVAVQGEGFKATQVVIVK